ncbi:MAG: tyrosine protein phosphatase [Desulfobacteraceae bacterium]|nr:tyrosine protein phosphatase [Desulfobacteraceae bacterium]
MIDTHSHILPALDDGARGVLESLKFVEIAASQGVETIFATPHAHDGVFNCDRKKITQACALLTGALIAKGISTKILPGSEIRVNHDLVTEYDKGNLLSLNNSGKWLLLELPPLFLCTAISMMLRQLKDRGVTPIIAHAERNPTILNQPQLVDEFIQNGAVIQITAASLTGDFGKFPLKTAKTMVELDQVFCLGSDIHPGREYCMANAKKELIRLAGRTKAELITSENPATMLENTKFPYKNVLSLGIN